MPAMSGKPRALVSWSSGKDSAFALHLARQAGALELTGVLTTFNEEHGRVAMHAVREALLDAQVAALGLPVTKVLLPWPCTNAVYEERSGAALLQARAAGVTHVVFGDLYLADIRAYREATLAAAGLTAVFPLWKRDTAALAREMIESGLEAILVCVDPRKLPRSFAGRRFDAKLLADLPAGVDPCGENGEFHTFVTAGPMFARPLEVNVGAVVERDGFVFADVLPAAARR
jgi:uncharacterized protein (TIGR00290 family)